MQSNFIYEDKSVNRGLVSSILEDKSNRFGYSYVEIVYRIIETRNEVLVRGLQTIIDSYVYNRNLDQ